MLFPRRETCRQNRSEAIWSRALKKEIVHVPRAQSTHIHPGVKPILQRKRAPLAGGIQGRGAEEYSALTTHHCLLRGVIWGADFIQTGNGGGRLLLCTGTKAAPDGIVVRAELALSNGGRRRTASAAREVVICATTTAVVRYR